MEDSFVAERVGCLNNCDLNRGKLDFAALAQRNNALIGEVNGSRLYFAPVGNFPESPKVIVCGKTAGKDTKDDLWNLIRNGVSPGSAARQTVYSNMRGNLFRALEHIGLFDYLAENTPYWRGGEPRDLWENTFTDDKASRICGIQLTQACNCSIVRLSKGRENSKQPNRTTMNKLCKSAPDCLFRSFILTPSLRLIIFLDTPAEDNQFHPSKFLERSSFLRRHDLSHVHIISITHPSGQNNDIYINLERLEELADEEPDLRKRSRYRNAACLFAVARKTVEEMARD